MTAGEKLKKAGCRRCGFRCVFGRCGYRGDRGGEGRRKGAGRNREEKGEEKGEGGREGGRCHVGCGVIRGLRK